MTASDPPTLVPELLVSDVPTSVAFWCGLCGFETAYERREEGFAYLAREGAHVMLEQTGIGRNWITGILERPLGRGLNLQIGVSDPTPILSALREAGHPLFMEPEAKRYRISDETEVEVEQFLVMDPDGYLIRFQSPLPR